MVFLGGTLSILLLPWAEQSHRFGARRQLVLEEANAIGTTYLRAGLLPDTQRLEVRRLLREYADVRLPATLENIHEMLKQSEEIHGRLWSQAMQRHIEDTGRWTMLINCRSPS